MMNCIEDCKYNIGGTCVSSDQGMACPLRKTKQDNVNLCNECAHTKDCIMKADPLRSKVTECWKFAKNNASWQDHDPALISRNDNINRPAHYTYGKIECIDYIRDKQFDFCLGNAIKYITRAGHKGDPVEDLKKAIKYIEFEIEALNEKG